MEKTFTYQSPNLIYKSTLGVSGSPLPEHPCGELPSLRVTKKHVQDELVGAGREGTNPSGMQRGPDQIPGCEQSFRGSNIDFIINARRAGFPLKLNGWGPGQMLS